MHVGLQYAGQVVEGSLIYYWIYHRVVLQISTERIRRGHHDASRVWHWDKSQ